MELLPVRASTSAVHRGARLVVGSLFVMILSGCGGSPSSSASSWTSPAWMVDQAQAREQFVAALQTCMDAKGWHLTADESAGFAEPFSSQEEMDRALDDKNDCLRDQGIDPDQFGSILTEAELRTMYSYDVDTYQCLVAQGVKMETEPPSVDVYIEQGLAEEQDISEAWLPYFDPAIMAMSQDEVAQLEQVCPTRWVFATP